jgi:hypothetical protein
MRGIEIMKTLSEDWPEKLLTELPISGTVLELNISGNSKKIYSRIKGFVELKIRALLIAIERLGTGVDLRPYPDLLDASEDGLSGKMAIGISFPPTSSATVPDLRPAVDRWMKQLAEWNERDEVENQFDVTVSFKTDGNVTEPQSKRVRVQGELD